MNKPLATCVCVTYDRPYLLNELLYCFLNQDYENKELIIVNDKSDVIYEYNDPRVTIYNLNERFASLGEKRNFSRLVSNGDYVFITDDDDIYYSNHISRLLNFHLDNQDYDIVSNNIGEYSEWNDGIHNWNIYVSFNGACIKREYWKSNEFPKNKSCGEDADFTKNAKIKHIEDDITTFHYRWGLDIHHISGLGGDGIESYNMVTENTILGEKQTIHLTPFISNKVKLYYQ